MIGRSAWTALIAGLLAAATGTAARAQDAPAVISPLQVAPDNNNINLHDGRTRIEMPVLSVPGAPNLRFDRLQNAAPYITGRILTPSGSEHDQRSYAVHTGAESSEAFDCFDYECMSVTATGSTFAWNQRLYQQAGSGAVWQFSLLAVSTPSPNQSLAYYASNVTYPNGEIISFTYDSATPGLPYNRRLYRPIKLTSNLGFYISISYANDTDPLSNDWSRITRAAIYSSASSTPLRTFVYDGATITELDDTGSNGRTYSCTGCVNMLGLDIEVGAGSTQLPGESSPALQVAALNGNDYSVVGAVTRDGVPWTYGYDNLRLQTGTLRYLFDRMTVNGPNGFHQVYDVDNSYHSISDVAANRIHTTITRATDSIGRSTSYQYDFYDRPIRAILPELNEVSIVYDGYSNIVSRTAIPKPGSPLSPITESAFFPIATCDGGVLCYRPLWTRDGLNRQTDYAYNEYGQLTEQIDPADANEVRRKTIITYESVPGYQVGTLRRRRMVTICGVGTTCGTSAEIRTEYEYWGTSFLPSLERRYGGPGDTPLVTTYSYNLAGRLTSTDGPLPGSDDATWNRYDAYGRKTWEIGAPGANGLRIATRTSYRDADDRPVSVEIGTLANATSSDLQNIRRADTAYDGRRNPIRETVSAAGTTFGVVQRSFDDRGQPVCEATRMNPALFAAPPADPCVPGAQGTGANDYGPDRIGRNVYDAAGQRLQHRVGVGFPDIEAAEASWEYNANGQISAVIDGNGNRAELGYDDHMRQDRWTFPSATGPAGTVNAADYEAYTYDDAGNRLTLRKRDGSVLTYQYDNLNRLTRKTVPERAGLDSGHTRDVFYGYDLRNLQLYARFDSATGPGIVNAYDGFGRLASTTTDVVGAARMLSYQYDPAGRRTRITHPEPGPGQAGPFFTYDYDPAGRLTGIDQLGNSDVLGLTYHPLGERYVLGRGLSALGWLADPLGRPTYQVADLAGDASDAIWTFVRNPASGIARMTRSNDAYAWTGHYAVSRAYQTNGLNQYSGTASTLGNAAFTYDLNGNLVTTPGPNGQTIAYTYDIENRLVAASGGGGAVQLGYDPLGRLAWTTGSPSFASFLYDGDNLVAEYDYGGTVTERYVHGPGPDEPWLWYHGAAVGHANLRLPFADQQGSIVAVSTYMGELLAINRYDEYGIPASTNSGRFQYTGQTWLAELGLYHYKARLYSPSLGRFLQTDPVGYQDQFNLYAYVGNDPVNRTDPTGRWICTGTRILCLAVRSAINRVAAAAERRTLPRAQRALMRRVVERYGQPGHRNGIVVRFDTPQRIYAASRGAAYTDYNERTGESEVVLPTNFDTTYNNFRNEMISIGRRTPGLSRFSAENERGNMIADEGRHAMDQQRLGRDLSASEWHPAPDLRSAVSRSFGTSSVQEIRRETVQPEPED